MVHVFVRCVRPGRWKALASLGVGVAASSRSEALRQLRRSAHAELGELKIIEAQPDGELND